MVTTPVRESEPQPAPSGFGFRVHTRVPLRFLRSGGGVEPLEIVVASGPRPRPGRAPLADWPLAGGDHDVRGTLYQAERGFEFWTTDAGAYRIDLETGRIEIPEHPDDVVREQRLWGIPAALCVMYRGDIPLHAAAVQLGAGAILLAGPRRHGKTTLALAFHRQGYRVLSEDLACCRPTPVPTLLPGPALLRLRPDVYDGMPPPGTHVVASRPDRVYLAMDDGRKGSGAPVPIAAIVFLRRWTDGIALEPMSPADALRALWGLSLHLPSDAARARAFSQLTRLVGTLPLWNLDRPGRLDSLDPTVEQIVQVCRV